MAGEQRQQFEVIKEGFAKAIFGGAISGGSAEAVGGPISFAALEDNGGLDPAEFYCTYARLLSQAVTPYRKFDFTKDGVLKSAVGMFEGLTLYANHYADVNQWKGLVQDCSWDDTNNPPGINAMLVLDRTIDAKLARGVEIKALRSTSVTIWFEYERSHPDLANFYDRLGEIVDGQMVRFIVNKITQAGEVSIVWEGEDPFAKTFAVPDGSVGSDRSELSKDEGEGTMKIAAATLAMLGLAAGTEVTEAMLEEKINETVSGFKTQLATLKIDAEVGVATLTEARERAVTLYKLAKGEKVVESFITGVIETADLATARAFCQEYQQAVDDSAPLKCAKCGEPLSRRSSQETDADTGGQATLGGKRAEDYKL